MKTKTIKIATLGAAVQDVYLLGAALKAKRDVRTHDFVEQFPLGAKVELDRVVFSTGGGATNAAVTFARHGFETEFLGKIGDDVAGVEVVKALKAEGIDTAKISCDTDGTTGYSVLLLSPGGERTVLVYRGVSQELKAEDFANFAGLTADWLYITSLAGNLVLLEAATKYASANNIKIAIDPGSAELSQPDRLKKIIECVAVLKGNKEEIGKLYPGKNVTEILRQAAKACSYVIVTDGPNGCWATDGKHIYHAGIYEDVPVLDRTGAGDAFGSGLVAKLADGAGLEEALIFGSANSTSVVQQIGSKPGILAKGSKLNSMKITKQPLRGSDSGSHA